MTRRMTRGIAALLLAGLTATVPGASPARADDGDPVDTDYGRLLLLLDSSGSMKEPAGGGTTKIDAARDALTTVIDGLPDDADVGLRVFGATVFSRNDAGACQDTQLAVKPGTGNRDELRDAVQAYKPYGETPIPAALRAAARDLGGEGKRSIVLVSDGESTCAPDPCSVAKQIAQQGIDLQIDVVGLSVSGKARRQLQCIAANGGGDYYDADDADDIADSLTDAAERATRPFGLTGTPIKGTVEVADAPLVTTGQYLDKAPASGERFYRFERTAAGSTVHFGAIFQSTKDDLVSTLFARIGVVDEDGELQECGSTILQTNAVFATTKLVNEATSSAKADPEDVCNTAGELVLSVEPSNTEALGGKPLQLMVYEEPPLSQAALDDLPPATDEPTWTEPAAADPQDGPLPGDTLDSAPVLEPGSYRFDINPGENQVIGIPVAWGQHVVARFDARLTDAIRRNWGADAGVELEVIGPLGGDATVSLSGDEPEGWCTGLILGCSDKWVDGVVSHPVTYRNRFGSSGGEAAALPGIHYVQVRYSLDEPINVPYTLTVDVVGDEQPAPAYDDVAGLEPPTADSRLVAAAADETQDDGGGARAKAAGSSGDDGDTTVRVVAGGAAGVLGLAALGGGLWLWRRRLAG